MTRETLYALWLLTAGGLGRPSTYRLICRMTAEDAFLANPTELKTILPYAEAAPFGRKDLTQALRIQEICEEKSIQAVSYHEPDYPAQLREIYQPPVVLFYRGKLPQNDMPSLGIVGTRRCSQSAARMTAEFSCKLAQTGFQIISGMAEGIDTYAHKGSLFRHFASFAVLGCGVDVIYPKQNRILYDLLCQEGGVLSEFLPGTQPAPEQFPMRNRIISGLSDGVLVMECPVQSGSMITARTALEQDRTVFAIPNSPADRKNTGTNFLIKQGAILCTEPADILEEYLPRYRDKLTPTALTGPAIKTRLNNEETDLMARIPSLQILKAEDLCRLCGRGYDTLLPILRGLEVAGCIKSFPGALFIKL